MASEIEPAERIEFEVFSRVCDLHPELVERFLVLGLLETVSDDEGRLWFERRQVAAVGRIRRLRSGLGSWSPRRISSDSSSSMRSISSATTAIAE